MKVNKKFTFLCIFVILISLCGAYAAYNYQNTNNIQNVSEYNNSTADVGCCSVILQLEGDNSILSYRRDAQSSAEIHIDEIDWHGKNAIRQHKDDGGYFTHVVITEDGWIIGLGGVDDGEDNKKCEEIASKMVNDNNNISESYLSQIQQIKQPYGKGHFIIKAPNGNYGFATVDQLKTGKLEPGRYISLPNNYQYSRSGDFSLNTSDKVKSMIDLARTDAFGLSRRDIITYEFNVGDNSNNTDIYVSNDDGSAFGMSNGGDVDDVYVGKNLTKTDQIPIAPSYKKIANLTFVNENNTNPMQSGGGFNLSVLLTIIVFVVFVGVLFSFVLRFVRNYRYYRRRRR